MLGRIQSAMIGLKLNCELNDRLVSQPMSNPAKPPRASWMALRSSFCWVARSAGSRSRDVRNARSAEIDANGCSDTLKSESSVRRGDSSGTIKRSESVTRMVEYWNARRSCPKYALLKDM